MKNDTPDPWLATKLIVMTAVMFTFTFFLMPPLYDAFCELTGISPRGSTTAAVIDESTLKTSDVARIITVQFTTTVNESAPYAFKSQVSSMKVKPGQFYDAVFVAENLTDNARTAQAIPSITPTIANQYFKKVECFCFNNQDFAGGESKQMPLRYLIDEDLPEYIDTVTLAYTFFNVESAATTNR